MTTMDKLQADASEYLSLRYSIRCDDCKREIGRTDNMRESAEGGRCSHCRKERK